MLERGEGIDFLKYRFFIAFISLCFVGGFVGFSVYKMKTHGSAFSYDVDFTGGVQVLFRTDVALEVELIKAALEKNGWRNPVIREFGDKEYLVRVKDSVSDVRVFSDQMKHAIMSDAAISQITILQEESVGPGIGEELRWKSVRAIGVALLVLLIYITLVFRSYAFAVGAVVALVHDALAMLALFLLVDRDISLNVIAAILAVLGYSINDTIVIFSSIKKNLQDSHGLPLYAIVNKSIQHMLRRTLLTSISTALTVGSLLLFGGEALKDFSLTFLIGVIFGTYSSIYIASPVMMLLYKEGQK